MSFIWLFGGFPFKDCSEYISFFLENNCNGRIIECVFVEIAFSFFTGIILIFLSRISSANINIGGKK